MLPSVLSQLYPHEKSSRRDILICIGTGLFIGLFLLVFKPFGISNWQTPYLELKIAGYGLVTTLILAIRYFLFPVLFPRFNKSETWTLGAELGSTMIMIFSIAVINFWYLKLFLPVTASHVPFLNMIAYTFVLGIFPVSALICLNYIIQLNKYLLLASSLPVHQQVEEAIFPELSFTAESGHDKITVKLNELVFIEAEDNYTGINYYLNGLLVKRLLRNSLSRIGGQHNQEMLVRCHRSFIINMNHVEKVIGNAQGYRFCIRNSTVQVPVGRNYNQLVQSYKSIPAEVKV